MTRNLTLTIPQPKITKTFAASTLNVGDTTKTTLKIETFYGLASSLSGNLTDNLPAGLVYVPGTAANTCGGAMSTTTTSVTLNSGSPLPIGGCEVTFDVRATGPGGVTVTNTIPAGGLRTAGDNGLISLATSDTLIINPAPIIRVRKTTVGGFGGPFQFAATNLQSTIANITTTTANTAQPVSPAAQYAADVGTDVTLTETPATGYKLTAASCIDANAGTTGNTGSIGTLSGNTLTIPAARVTSSSNYTCTFTNTLVASVLVKKTTKGGFGGPFSFSVSNLNSTPSAITTIARDTATATASGRIEATNFNTAVSLTEAPATGYVLTDVSCIDTNSAVTGNNSTIGSASGNVSGNTLTIPAANVVRGATFECTFTNTKIPTIQVNKISQGGIGTFTFTQTNLVANPGNLTTLTAGTQRNGTPVNVTEIGKDVTLSEGVVAGYKFGSVSCSDANSAVTNNTGTFWTVDASNKVTIPASAVVAGAQISCTFTNNKIPLVTIKKVSQGAIGKFDFTMTNLALASTSLTTTTVGTAEVTTPAEVTTIGSAVTLTEAAVTGYNAPVVSCTDANSAVTNNTGTFWTVSGNSVTLPAANVKAGADITCTFTNNRTPTVTLSKVSQGGVGTFTFAQTNLAANPGNLTTITAGTAVTGTAVNVSTIGTAVTVTESPATGYALTDVSCTDANSGVTGKTGTFGSYSGNVVTIPAGNVVAGAAIRCTLTNSKIPTVTLSKISQGGVGTFAFTQTNLATNPGNLTTLTAGAQVSGTAVNVSTIGTAVTITESPAAGYALTDVSCTDTNSAVTGKTGTFGSFSGNVVTIPAGNVVTAAAISCTLTNSKAPTVTLTKVSQGGVGTFVFTQTNLAANPGNLTTLTAGTKVSGTAVNVSAIGTAVTITESPAAGYALTDVSCTDANSAVTGKTGTFGSFSGNVVTIPVGNVVAGAAITCDLTNTRLPTLTVRKTSLGGVGSFSFSTTATSNLSTTPASITTATAGTAVGNAAVAVSAVNTAVIFSEIPAAGYKLTGATCSDSNSTNTGNPATFGGLTANANEVQIPATNVKAGAVITCSLTNTKWVTVTLTKTTVGGAGTFAFTQTNLDANPASITTVTPGTAVSGTATSVTALNSDVTITEQPASGYKLTAASCTDANSGASGNPASFGSFAGNVVTIPAANVKAGAAISCALTNTAIGLTGRVFADIGTSGGTANDGVLNGGEVGLSGIAVRLTNCAGTTYSSALTDASGAYTLTTLGLPAGGTVCVEETNPGGMISTGASIGTSALPSGTATSVAGTAYTYSRAGAIDRIAFAWDGLAHSNVNFGDVPDNIFAANGAKNAVPGSTVGYPHTFTAGTAGTVAFSVPSAIATPALAGWTQKIFADPTCSGTLQPGADQLYPPLGAGQTVSAGATVCIIVEEFIPATAQAGNSDDISVQADFKYANALPTLRATYTLHDVTTVGSSALDLRKEVRNITSGEAAFGINNRAKSGDVLEYRISYTNNAPTVITNLVISDKTPVFTTFMSSDVYTTPATLTACSKTTPANPAPAAAVACSAAQTAGGQGPLIWTFVGSLEPGVTGSVTFQVAVQ